MGISGVYVKTFAEASHAVPMGMPMNADYPFMLARIVSLKDDLVEIAADSGFADNAVFAIHRPRKASQGREFGFIEQSSSFEKLFNRKPQRFEMRPFKDENTPAIGKKAKG